MWRWQCSFAQRASTTFTLKDDALRIRAKAHSCGLLASTEKASKTCCIVQRSKQIRLWVNLRGQSRRQPDSNYLGILLRRNWRAGKSSDGLRYRHSDFKTLNRSRLPTQAIRIQQEWNRGDHGHYWLKDQSFQFGQVPRQFAARAVKCAQRISQLSRFVA